MPKATVTEDGRWVTGCYCGHNHILLGTNIETNVIGYVCDGPCAPHSHGTEGVK